MVHSLLNTLIWDDITSLIFPSLTFCFDFFKFRKRNDLKQCLKDRHHYYYFSYISLHGCENVIYDFSAANWLIIYTTLTLFLLVRNWKPHFSIFVWWFRLIERLVLWKCNGLLQWRIFLKANLWALVPSYNDLSDKVECTKGNTLT